MAKLFLAIALAAHVASACSGPTAPANGQNASVTVPPAPPDSVTRRESALEGTRSPIGARTPEDAWAGLLEAMRGNESLDRFATPAGIASLEAGAGSEPRATVFARWGSGWARWEMRWRQRAADHADAVLGPEVKEHGLRFVRTAAGWKLDKWTPGE